MTASRGDRLCAKTVGHWVWNGRGDLPKRVDVYTIRELRVPEQSIPPDAALGRRNCFAGNTFGRLSFRNDRPEAAEGKICGVVV
jgi:hypothetical protein